MDIHHMHDTIYNFTLCVFSVYSKKFLGNYLERWGVSCVYVLDYFGFIYASCRLVNKIFFEVKIVLVIFNEERDIKLLL